MEKKKISVFDVFLTGLMSLLCFAFLIPFWIIVVASLSDNLKLITNGISLWFQGFSFAGYKLLFGMSEQFLRSIWVSVATSTLAAIFAVVVCTACAYSLSKKYLVGRKFFNATTSNFP